ncbi:unnamed protein product [Oppiella nova]|uniref:Uncharacterized protein n=1 Tax=Oppiella nova TaxID=334625 RepID=A0A7R9LBE1_9ACAR|nr:unnamed protein product [Oppiella nova]CAG2161869.1 unnamed protein product [Oppiella nova]
MIAVFLVSYHCRDNSFLGAFLCPVSRHGVREPVVAHNPVEPQIDRGLPYHCWGTAHSILTFSVHPQFLSSNSQNLIYKLINSWKHKAIHTLHVQIEDYRRSPTHIFQVQLYNYHFANTDQKSAQKMHIQWHGLTGGGVCVHWDRIGDLALTLALMGTHIHTKPIAIL